MIHIQKEKDDSFRFRLMTESGHTLLTSIPFTNRKDIEKTMGNLPLFEESLNVFERKTNHEGQFLFSLKDASGNLIAYSEPFTSEAGMENGIANVRSQIDELSNYKLI